MIKIIENTVVFERHFEIKINSVFVHVSKWRVKGTELFSWEILDSNTTIDKLTEKEYKELCEFINQQKV